MNANITAGLQPTGNSKIYNNKIYNQLKYLLNNHVDGIGIQKNKIHCTKKYALRA